MSNDPRAPGGGPPESRRVASEPADPRTGASALSRKTTVRLPSASAGAAPASRPNGADSETSGRIFRICRWLDDNRGAFAVSRLIMQAGIDLRAFGAETKDDARAMVKLWSVLDGMLLPEERESLLRASREG